MAGVDPGQAGTARSIEVLCSRLFAFSSVLGSVAAFRSRLCVRPLVSPVCSFVFVCLGDSHATPADVHHT